MFHRDRLPVLSNSIELSSFHSKKKKEKKNSHSLSIFVSNNFFAWNEDYPKIDWKGILIWFRKYKKKNTSFNFHLFLSRNNRDDTILYDNKMENVISHAL